MVLGRAGSGCSETVELGFEDAQRIAAELCCDVCFGGTRGGGGVFGAYCFGNTVCTSLAAGLGATGCSGLEVGFLLVVGGVRLC